MAIKIARIAIFVETSVLPTNPLTVDGKLKIFSTPEIKNMESNKIEAIKVFIYFHRYLKVLIEDR